MGLAFIILAALGGSALVYRKVSADSSTKDSSSPRDYSVNGGTVSAATADKGISSNERTAMAWALDNEKDGAKLREFGQVMLPDFPIASSILLTKSGALIYRGSPVGSLNPNGPVTKAATAVAPVLVPRTTTNIQSGLTFRGISSFGNIFDLDNYTDAVTSVGQGVVDVIHYVPGVDELGDALKDFAKTGFGEWALRVMSTYGYYVMAPYLGAQLAAISFALPGVLKADPFTEAWLKETIDRVIKTAQILLANQVKFPELGNAASDAMNKFLANNPAVRAMVEQATSQIGTATKSITDRLGAEIVQKLQSGAEDALQEATASLATQYGMPPDFAKMAKDAGGIQEVNAAAAYDLIARTNYQGTVTWDAATGIDVLAHMKSQRLGSVQTMRTSISPGQMAIDALNAQYRAKRPIVVAYYLQKAGA